MTTSSAGRLSRTSPTVQVCPWCGQPIPHDKVAETIRRIRQNERAHIREIERRVRDEQAAAVAQTQAAAERQLREAKQRSEAQAAEARHKVEAAVEAAVAAAVAKTETALVRRLEEQRRALEKATAEAINAEKAKAFADRQQLHSRLTQLQRQVTRKAADQLGEGADVDLYEQLREEFATDKIGKVKQGGPGADIVQLVVENGRECGCIVYDSKDKGAWRRSYVARLLEDKIAAKAEHAVLVTRAFPAGHAQLFVQDGVIVANPARAIALAQVLRKHVVQLATLRLGTKARLANTSRLYEFITSDRFGVLLEQIGAVSDRLLELDVEEHTAHTSTWKQRGRLIREIQQARGTLVTEIDLIVTASDTSARERR
jgi:hypothetical protein